MTENDDIVEHEDVIETRPADDELEGPVYDEIVEGTWFKLLPAE